MSQIIMYTIITLVAIGSAAAIILYFVARRFKVYEDPRIDQVEEALPAANCGGCGFPGCRNFAETLVKSESWDELFCPVGGNETMARVAAILGKEAIEQAPRVAVVRCNGTPEFRPGQKDYSLLVDKTAQADVRALVLIAAAEESAQVICTLRARDFQGFVFGGATMGSSRFLKRAGKAAEGVIFPLLYTAGKESDGFEDEFTRCFGDRPDYLAAHTYDSVSLLIAAMRQAGLNRASICDSVRELSPYQGVTGTIRWDSLGSNCRPVGLGTVRAGRVICASGPHARDDAKTHSSRR